MHHLVKHIALQVPGYFHPAALFCCVDVSFKCWNFVAAFVGFGSILSYSSSCETSPILALSETISLISIAFSSFNYVMLC